MPLSAPIGDEDRKDPAVHRSEGSPAVGFTLIPDHAFNGVWNGRSHHAIEQRGGRPGSGVRAPGVWLRCLACLTGGQILTLFPRQDLCSFGLSPHHLSARGEDRHQRRVGGDGLETHPCFGHSAAPSGIDESDGNVLSGVQLTSEEVGRRREVGGRLRRACSPGCGAVPKREVRGLVGDVEQSNLRLAGWLACAISSAESFRGAPGKPFKGISMLGWPDANQTSPIRTSSRTILLLLVTVSWYGPPAASGGRKTLQFPKRSPRVSRLVPWNATATFSPGSDQPQMWIGRSRCNTI